MGGNNYGGEGEIKGSVKVYFCGERRLGSRCGVPMARACTARIVGGGVF